MTKPATRLVLILAFPLILIGGYFVLDNILFDGIRAQPINEAGFQGNLFVDENITDAPVIVLVGGGHWGDYWAREFAKRGYVGLSLPYNRLPGLPPLMENIPLEYFEKSIHWLSDHPSVDADKIVVMGASRNAELALILGATFPDHVHGVIAYAPSSVSWSNTVMPFNSDEVAPSWTYQNAPIPYVAMPKLEPGQTSNIETLPYWYNGLEDSAQAYSATIQVENLNGPLLLLSGKDDKVWPSAFMSDQIEARLQKYNFPHDFQNIQYENCGHLISGNPAYLQSQRKGSMIINNGEYLYEYGGSAEGDQQAQIDAQKRVFEFLEAL